MSALNMLMSAAGAGGADGKLYVDDVFSTYLYTGNGGTQTINNGIDLAKYGGLVWVKDRKDANSHLLASDPQKYLSSNTTSSALTTAQAITSFNSTGFSIGNNALLNQNGQTYASWTFRRAPKFFDVVTYTGNGVAGRQIPHSLGVAPGMVIVKSTSIADGWAVYHKDTGATKYMWLHSTQQAIINSAFWNNTEPTNLNFTVGINSAVNQSGATYVAYLFAHDPSADGIIQCGSYTGNGGVNGPSVTLGWEPQYLLCKSASGAFDWVMVDSMRGMPVGTGDANLHPNSSTAETTNNDWANPTATGFQITSLGGLYNTNGGTYIYLAIRRPNKPPTSGTEVYNAIARTGTGATATVTGVGFAPDLLIGKMRGTGGVNSADFRDRLRGAKKALLSSVADSEKEPVNSVDALTMDGFSLSNGADNDYVSNGGNDFNTPSATYINHFFRRAPGVMDVVVNSGTGAAQSIPHNLAVPPELVIRKVRGATGNWHVGHKDLSAYDNLALNTANAKSAAGVITNNAHTTTTFSVGDFNPTVINTSGQTFVTYLFATLPGISKVGSYTGNGSSQNIDCGFATGARFVLVKRTDNTGDWYVWDVARGILSANDPHLSLNTTAAEVTTDDSVDPYAPGFAVNQNTATNINVNGASYIFLAYS